MAAELTWLGHGSWSMDLDGRRVLLDPFLDDSPVASAKAEDIEAEFILLSHGHFDHAGDAAAIARQTGATVIANFEICDWIGGQGVKNIHPMNLGGGFAFPFGHVKMTIAHHTSTLPDGSSGGNPCGFVLSLEDGNVYFACDTGLFLDMKLIGTVGLELAVLPIGDNFTMGPDDALEAVKLLQPKRVVPVHYNTWPLIEQDPAAWAVRVKTETQAEPVVLKPGGKVVL